MHRQGETSQAANDMPPPERQTPVNQCEKTQPPAPVPEREAQEIETQAGKGESESGVL